MVPEKLLHSLVGDLDGDGDREAEVVEGHGEAHHVEVADRDDHALVDEHERIVVRAVELDLEHGARVLESVVERAMAAGDAAERKGILQVASCARVPEIRAVEQGA